MGIVVIRNRGIGEPVPGPMLSAITNLLPEEWIRRENTDWVAQYGPAGGNVACSVVLSGAERRSLHRPEVCLPAQGWNVTGKNIITLTLEDGRRVDAVLVQMLRDYAAPDGKARRIKALNLFFYAGSEGVTTADYYDHVFLSYLHSLTRNLNHRWALVSFYMPYSETEVGYGDPMAELGAMEELRDFAAKAAFKILKPL